MVNYRDNSSSLQWLLKKGNGHFSSAKQKIVMQIPPISIFRHVRALAVLNADECEWSERESNGSICRYRQFPFYSNHIHCIAAYLYLFSPYTFALSVFLLFFLYVTTDSIILQISAPWRSETGKARLFWQVAEIFMWVFDSKVIDMIYDWNQVIGHHCVMLMFKISASQSRLLSV